MIVSERVQERMTRLGLSQSELARRVGVTQPTIYKLLKTSKKGSTHLHRIARVLETTAAYLSGEIDDPTSDAPPPTPPVVKYVTMQVALPDEALLAQMFDALLAGINPRLEAEERAEQAQLLAENLPIGLSRLQGLRPVPRPAAKRVRSETSAPAPAAKQHREPQH